jgi:glycerate kinase
MAHHPRSNLRILVAPDKFKGSLTAMEAVDAICEGFDRALPDVRLHKLPLADGGEGTAELFVRSFGGQMVECETTDPLGRQITATYGWTPSMHQAVIEMSAASGLWRLREEEYDPLQATTFGTGTLMIDAARRGAKRIIVGLGGSATNDAGAGAALALGARFLDERGSPLTPSPRNFHEIARVERPSRVFVPEVVVISDVRIPLLGDHGASHGYGPQKGASPETVDLLERALRHLADVIQRDLFCDFRSTAGSGAGGGLGFGLQSFLGAKIRSGFDTFAELMELDRLIGEVDLVVTGEGLLDPQTLDGKGPGGIAHLAQRARKPVIAFAGAIRSDRRLEDFFDATFALANGPMAAADSIRDAKVLLVRAAERVARLIALSRNL